MGTDKAITQDSTMPGHTHASTTSFFSSRSVSSCPFQESVDGSQAVALSLSCGHSLFLRSHQSSGRLSISFGHRDRAQPTNDYSKQLLFPLDTSIRNWDSIDLPFPSFGPVLPLGFNLQHWKRPKEAFISLSGDLSCLCLIAGTTTTLSR